jgi:hypothetical protein
MDQARSSFLGSKMTNGLIAEGVIVVAENGRVGLRLDQARLVNNDRQAGSLKIRQRDDEPTIRPE